LTCLYDDATETAITAALEDMHMQVEEWEEENEDLIAEFDEEYGDFEEEEGDDEDDGGRRNRRRALKKQ